LRSLSDEAGFEETTRIEVVRDPRLVQNSYDNLVRSAQREILLFLPTTSAFVREEKIGIIQSLVDAAGRGVNVKVLTPTDKKIGPRIEAMLRNRDNIEIRWLRQKPLPCAASETRTKILIIDRKLYLIVELGDDSKETFLDAVRSGIQSNSRSTVTSYVTLFESLWQESELYDQLEVHDRMQQEFINIASHELRTPIQPILGAIELLEDRFTEEYQECKITNEEFQLLVRNAKRLARLSSDILEVSKIDSNSLNLYIQKFDINEEARNVVIDARKIVEPSKRLEIEIKAGEPVFVSADKTKIFEVMSNLLTNAIKFTDEGKITMRVGKVDGSVQIQVKDGGRGIDAAVMPKLFTKFMTTSDQGMGLGLYISKNIVEAHGGRIWAENNKDERGANFNFTLPIASA
jgi:two-component system sensor histidine kinase VicK